MKSIAVNNRLTMNAVSKFLWVGLLLVGAGELMASGIGNTVMKKTGRIDKQYTYEKYIKGSRHVIRLVCNKPTCYSVMYGVQEYVLIDGKLVNINAGRKHKQYQLSGLMLFNQFAAEHRCNN